MDPSKSRWLVRKMLQIHILSKGRWIWIFVHLIRKAGQPIHNDHPKPNDPSIIPIPFQLLDKHEWEEIINVVQSTSGQAHDRNFMHGKFGKFVNSLTVDYLYRKSNNIENYSDDIASMLNNFEKYHETTFTMQKDVTIESTLDYSVCTLSFTFPKWVGWNPNNKKGRDVLNEPLQDEDLTSLLPLKSIAQQEQAEQSQTLWNCLDYIDCISFFHVISWCDMVWCYVLHDTQTLRVSAYSLSHVKLPLGKSWFWWLWIPNQQRFSFWCFLASYSNTYSN